VAVISSIDAAGYKDFIKIINDRWGGLKIDVAHVQVQGVGAPDQMIRALKHFNEQEELPEAIVLIRGGGSADDLSAFNDEPLVREIAASRVPTLVGVGHEVDISLADMAADVRAATPSDAAQILVPDRHEIVRAVRQKVVVLLPRTEQAIERWRQQVSGTLEDAFLMIEKQHERYAEYLHHKQQLLAELDPRKVLTRGYALIRGELVVGATIEIEKSDSVIKAEVYHVSKKA
jgi:exodeoxyribonuclease VII large subunit